MSDLVQLIQEADLAMVDLEQSRATVEGAKLALEVAKEEYERSRSAFELVIARADEVGVPRAKLKKLVEERAASLLASGLMSIPVNQPRVAKAPRQAKKKTQREDAVEATSDADFSSEDRVEVHLDA